MELETERNVGVAEQRDEIVDPRAEQRVLKIDQRERAIGGEHQVLRLVVAVHEALGHRFDGVRDRPEAFVEDVRLVFRNARSYNDPGSDVHAMARTLQEKFEDRYAASIVPRLVEAQKQRDADKIELRRRMAEQKALGGRERADGECAAIIQAIDSLLADVDIEKIKAATACGPVSRKEKEALVEKFREMDESVLGKALGIVFHHFPGVKGPSEVAFDVETLDSLCLRQVMSYVEGTEHDGKKIWPPKAYIAKGL